MNVARGLTLYPRRYCLGLIEAIRGITCPGDPLRPYPRRYCLGLIEAPQSTSLGGGSGGVSEALLPRPH